MRHDVLMKHFLHLQITRGLTQELNRLYTLFCSRNPEFEERGGKVSIVSHSLGCVITYDIMTGWDPVRFCLQEHQAVEEQLELHWMSYEEQHLLEQLRLTRTRYNCSDGLRLKTWMIWMVIGGRVEFVHVKQWLAGSTGGLQLEMMRHCSTLPSAICVR